MHTYILNKVGDDITNAYRETDIPYYITPIKIVICKCIHYLYKT